MVRTSVARGENERTPKIKFIMNNICILKGRRMKPGQARYKGRGRHQDEQASPEGMEGVDVEVRRIKNG